VGNIAAVSIVN